MKKIHVPDCLIGLGLATVAGVAVFSHTTERAFLFGGVIVAAVGYFWQRFTSVSA